jgi:hypothetical protein
MAIPAASFMSDDEAAGKSKEVGAKKSRERNWINIVASPTRRSV